MDLARGELTPATSGVIGRGGVSLGRCGRGECAPAAGGAAYWRANSRAGGGFPPCVESVRLVIKWVANLTLYANRAILAHSMPLIFPV